MTSSFVPSIKSSSIFFADDKNLADATLDAKKDRSRIAAGSDAHCFEVIRDPISFLAFNLLKASSNLIGFTL
jgi:hypothetical protein